MSSSNLPTEAPLLDPLDGRDGPALRLSDTEQAAAVEAALERALPARPLRARPRAALLVLAAALALSGIAAAFALAPRWFGGGSTAPSAAIPAPVSPRPAPLMTSKPTEPVPPVPGSAAGPSSVDEGPSPSSGAAVSAASERTATVGTGSAADLLKAANQLRRQGQWAEAERAYANIARHYGASAQGPVAALAAASLRLEHLSDPRGALRLYQSAKKAPSLSAEAELGVANCYRALGDREAEIAALRRVTAAHPEALFHDRAVRRLQTLESQTP